jgi:hypothetical protein
MDKVKYPSDKFTVAIDVMHITKDDVFKYLINPENKYGFEFGPNIGHFVQIANLVIDDQVAYLI